MGLDNQTRQGGSERDRAAEVSVQDSAPLAEMLSSRQLMVRRKTLTKKVLHFN